MDSILGRIWARLRTARVALLAAGLSYYFIASLLPILVLASGVLGFVSRRNDEAARAILDELGVTGDAATLITDSIEHAEDVHVTSSVIGLLGVLWAALAVAGALRRAVDAVWAVPDVGWTARLRSLPWAIVAMLLASGSLASTAWVAWAGSGAAVVGVLLGVSFTAALASWFLARLGSRTPTRRALGVSTVVLTVGLEVIKYSAAFVVPRLVSRDSALYGSLGSAFGLLAVVLAASWLLLVATSVAAEMTDSDVPLTRQSSSRSL